METNGHIGGLFHNLRARLSKHLIDRATIIRIVFEETKIKLDENDVTFKKGVLTLRLSPLKKSALYIKKEAILTRIASETNITVSELR